jgi:sigma-E factor negative regulatory protein RseC
MNRVGKVVSCSKGFAMVEMNRTTACSGCTGCGNENDDSGEMQIRVLNQLDAEKGDIVEINMDTQNVLLAALIAYGFPFLGLILGIVGGQMIFNNELLSALSGFALLGLTYFTISLNEKKFHLSDNYVPTIVKIHQKYQDVCFIVE